MAKHFSLLVKPTSADCNLRCEYCFYLPRAELYPDSVRHRMSDEVLERMILSYMATDQPQYAFGWQGGEPLLMGADFFRRATELQKKHGRRGAVVANGLQTNGTLVTDEMAEHFATYKFLAGVSVDGPAEIHDRFRHTAGGRGSHADVMRGMERLRRAGVEVNALTLVSAANVSHPRETYRYLKEQGLLFHQYIPCVELGEGGGLTPHSITGEQWGDFLCAVFDAWCGGDRHTTSVRLFDSVMRRYFDGSTNVCHMGRDCRQYFVVEHNGDVYPCDFFVDRELRLGNVMDDSWDDLLASEAYAEFGARKVKWNDACAECEFVDLCAGDCLKHRPPRGGDPRALSALCEGWRRFYGHALPSLKRFAEEERARREARQRSSAAVSAGQGAGRNAPCPCGSGRKYKRCCMQRTRDVGGQRGGGRP